MRAYYYTSMLEDRDQDYSPLRPLVDWLDYNGFQMVTKTAREYTDAQGRKRYRGSVDVELAVDMVLMAEKLDCIVLFTGNGDFRHAISRAQEKGCRVVCVSTMATTPPMASDDIRRQADLFVDLTDLEGVIARKGGQKKEAAPAPVDNDEDEFEDSYDGTDA